MISRLDTYLRLGWDLKPVAAGEKSCRRKGWPDLRPSPEELQRHVDDGGNLGLRLGATSAGLIDLDLDCAEALKLADIYLPATGAEFGRASKPRSHRLYSASGGVFASFADPLDGSMLVEFRGDGATGGAHLTLIPSSVADG